MKSIFRFAFLLSLPLLLATPSRAANVDDNLPNAQALLALELRADLIVISSHHAFWCDRFRQNNNNAAYILSHAPCPVLEVTDNGDSFLNGTAIPEVPGTLSSK